MGKAWLWAADESGCGWYRTVIVAEALRKLGHDVGQGVRITDEYVDSDAVLGQRVCNAGSTATWAAWNYERRVNTVFDADDDYFHMHEHPEFGAAAVEYGQSRIQARLLANAASARWTSCATPRLAEIFDAYCSNVVVVPNGLPERYLERPGPWERLSRKPVVGWAGSSFTQWELTDPIREVLSRVPEWGGQLHTVGVPHPIARKMGLTPPGSKTTGWIVGTENYLDAIDFDIWVAPYRRTRYNEAKVATKALEAAFLGIPIVASDTTPYRDFVQDGVTGILVGPGDSWTEAIRELMHNAQLRADMGRAAREQARDFTVEKIAATHWAPLLFGGLA